MSPSDMPARRRQLSYPNVMSTLAVFLVLAGGSALAAALPESSVTSRTVKNDSLRSKDLKDGKAVGGVDVKSGEVQLRVGEGCPEGQAIRVINLSGGVICEIDDQGAAGAGPPSGPAGGDLTGTFPDPAIAADAVNSAKVADNALTGDDITEASLGPVPAALSAGLGGTGRSAGNTVNPCDPESQTLIVCAKVSLNLPAPARVLVIGQILAEDEIDADRGVGSCELGTSVVDLPSTSTFISTGRDGTFATLGDNVTMVGVTPVLGPGNVEFRIRCNQAASGAIVYFDSEIAAVALSSN